MRIADRLHRYSAIIDFYARCLRGMAAFGRLMEDTSTGRRIDILAMTMAEHATQVENVALHGATLVADDVLFVTHEYRRALAYEEAVARLNDPR